MVCLHKNGNRTAIVKTKTEYEDCVSGIFYDTLQKEVTTLRKACHEKDQNLKEKEDAIEMLAKKVETLNKATEVKAKKMSREVAAMEKEVAAVRFTKEKDRRLRQFSAPRSCKWCLLTFVEEYAKFMGSYQGMITYNAR